MNLMNEHNTAIVTDSTSDIPIELAEQHSIHMIPNTLVLDGKSYQDGLEISREAFYDLLPKLKEVPTTAAAATGIFQNLYEDLLSQGFKKILSIHAPKNLSGIYNSARIAASNIGKNLVEVIDSDQISLGLGFQVLEAAEQAMRGIHPESIIHSIAKMRSRLRLVAMLDTLEYIRRSGRVSWARARLGMLLNIKPFVELREGQVFSLGESRTRQKGMARLAEILVSLGPLQKLAILHTNAEQDAHHFLHNLQINIPASTLVVQVTTVIGTHVGPKGIGFVALISGV